MGCRAVRRRRGGCRIALKRADLFREQCIGAFVGKNSNELRRLVAQAGDNPDLWVLMVKSTQETKQLDWVADAMDKRGVGLTDAYKEAAIARRKELE